MAISLRFLECVGPAWVSTPGSWLIPFDTHLESRLLKFPMVLASFLSESALASLAFFGSRGHLIALSTRP